MERSDHGMQLQPWQHQCEHCNALLTEQHLSGIDGNDFSMYLYLTVSSLLYFKQTAVFT